MNFFLLNRIPKESLRLEIQRLVKSNPLQVRHIPEALSIFTLNSDNDRQCEVNENLLLNSSLANVYLDISNSHLVCN